MFVVVFPLSFQYISEQDDIYHLVLPVANSISNAINGVGGNGYIHRLGT